MDRVSIDKPATEVCEHDIERKKEEDALVRRVDIALLPMLWLMYLFSYADRTK